jgi:hypothetical protein
MYARQPSPVMRGGEPLDELAEGVIGRVPRAFSRHVR